MADTPEFELVASATRLAHMRSAWRTLLIAALGLGALAAVSLLVFPPGVADRASLTIAGVILLVLALVLLVRLLLIRRAANRSYGPRGEVLVITPSALILAGDVVIPYEQVTGVFAKDDSATLLRKSSARVLGAGGRALMSAGLSGIDLVVGVRDGAAIRRAARTPSAAALVHIYPSRTAGSITIAFGATQDSTALRGAMSLLADRLEPGAPVRTLTGTFDLALAVAAFAEPETVIEKTRELPGS